MIMLIQQAEKKENSSSKRYEMSKWSFRNAILMADWNIVFTATLHFIVLKLWMTHKQMMNWILSRTFLTKEPIYNLTLEIYASLPMCLCVTFSAVVCQIGCWDIAIQWIFSKNISMYDMFNVLIRNNEHFDQIYITLYFLMFFLKK